MSKFVVDGTDATFEAEVLQSDVPVLVDFWAPWCGPCKTIGPVVEELAQEYQGRLKVVKINVEDHPNFAARYNVRGIPNMILFKGGEMKDQIIGAVPKTEIITAIKKLV